MSLELELIQKRLNEYESEFKEVLKQFHDSDSLNYFNDRFGYDNPRANDADRGILIERNLKKMKAEIRKFTEEFCNKYPEIKK